MAIKIKFDKSNRPLQPTFILATKSGKRLGLLNAQGIHIVDYLEQPCEFTFSVNKFLNNIEDPLKKKKKNFRLAYCIEWDTWFELVLNIEESTETIKNLSATALCEAELSQTNLYNIEINTENDIEREDYIPNIIFNPDNPKESILHRVLSKASNYSIGTVSESIRGLQRTFTFDSTSIHDALNNIASEIGCIFIYDNSADENGNPKRMVSAYDLENKCVECGYRGEFSGVCPKCGSGEIQEGYGQDTTIFVTADELTDKINFSTNTDAVKNVFKLEGGDDLMTATIRNANPNGGDYLWYITDDMKVDMSDELVEKLEEYDTIYNSYNEGENIDLDSSLVSSYNNLYEKYKDGNTELEKITTPLTGFSELMTIYYYTIDFDSYLSDEMMPTFKLADTTAEEQAEKLTNNTMSPCAVSKLDSLVLTSANNVVLSKAKSIVDARYKIEVESATFNKDELTWTGTLVITNYADEEDTATTEELTILFNDDLATYLKQQIDNYLAKNTDKNLSITELFAKEQADLIEELKKYNLNSLSNFQDAVEACKSIMQESGITGDERALVYQEIYTPYLEKSNAILDAIAERESEINQIKALEDNIASIKNRIQSQLDLEKFLGETLWKELALYRREDKYSNPNYTSEGLNNDEVFARALEFLETAKKEIYKSSTQQHSISCSLNNLLTIDKFKPLTNYFEVGNWIRVRVDDNIYKLRLVQYEIDYDSLDTISVEFSDLTTTIDGITDQASLISKAVAMTTSYDSVRRQANAGSDTYTVVKNWLSDGISSANLKMANDADSQTQVWNESGMLFRRLDPETQEYDSEQMKIINNSIVLTKDGWDTTSVAIGRIYYEEPATGETVLSYGVNAETLVGQLILGNYLGIYNSAGTMKFDDDGFMVTNGINTVSINPNDPDSLFTITKNTRGQDGSIVTTEVMSLNSDGDGSFSGKITSDEAHIGDDTNYVDFTDGVLTITAKNLTLLDDGDTNIMLNNLSNLSQADISQAAIDFLTSEMVTAGTISAALVQAEQGDFDSLTADNAFIDFLESNLIVASEIKVNDLKAKLAQIDSLEADSAFIRYLESELVVASEIKVDDLKAKLATIDTLNADTAFVRYLQGLSNTVIETKAQTGYFRDLIAGQISVDDLQAGDIVLSNNMRILSENGTMVMNGNALQIWGKYIDDEGQEQDYVGIQLGYDNSHTPSLILRNENGATILTPDGITSDAIADQLIINDMVKDGTLAKTKLGFEILEPNEQGGIDITKIYDGTQEFGASYTSFKNNTTTALEQLDDKIDNINNYDLYIECPNGTNIHGATLTFNAKLFNNNVDVTDEYDPSCFIWTRSSQDTYGDIYWNDRHSTGTKTIQVTANDVRINADFQCKFEYEGVTVTSG